MTNDGRFNVFIDTRDVNIIVALLMISLAMSMGCDGDTLPEDDAEEALAVEAKDETSDEEVEQQDGEAKTNGPESGAATLEPSTEDEEPECPADYFWSDRTGECIPHVGVIR